MCRYCIKLHSARLMLLSVQIFDFAVLMVANITNVTLRVDFELVKLLDCESRSRKGLSAGRIQNGRFERHVAGIKRKFALRMRAQTFNCRKSGSTHTHTHTQSVILCGVLEKSTSYTYFCAEINEGDSEVFKGKKTSHIFTFISILLIFH